MMINIKSLQAKLLNIARNEGIEYQLMINRYASEQFLVRLSSSEYVDKFIFKGGSLLAYLIDTDRKTKDLDFTLNQIGNDVDYLTQITKSVLFEDIDDGISWGEIVGTALSHPDMDLPGVRLYCHFLLGKMRGKIQLDLALGHALDAIKIPLRRIRYKDQPLMGPDIHILAYTRELIFAEKLQIAMYRGENNTRMRDYYDMFKLTHYDLDPITFKTCFEAICLSRKFEMANELLFSGKGIQKLQTYWEAYLNKSRLLNVPKEIQEIILLVNEKLEVLLER